MSHSEADPHTDKIQQLLFALGKAYLERHEYAQAQEKFRQLLEIGVDNPDVVLNAALSALSLHDLSNSALQLYERAVAANPHSRALLENLSALFVRAEVKTAFADEIIQLAMNVETESMALLPPSDSAQRDVLENLWWQGQFDGALVFLDDNHYSAQAVDLALTFAYQAIAKDETIHDEEKVARILNALEQISPAESLTSLRDYLTLRLSLPEILHETDTHNDDLEEFRFILGLISMEDFFSQLKNGVQRERFILRKFDLKTEILDALDQLESGYGQGESIHEVFQSVLLAENPHGQALPEQLLQLISSRLLEIPETVVRVSAHGFISLANDPVTHIKSAARILKQIADFNQSHPDSGHIIFNCVSVATNLPHTKDNQTLRDLVVATHLLRIAAKTNQPPSSPGLLLLVGDENLCVELRNAGLCVESHGTQPIMPQKTVCCHEIVWNNPVENIHHEHPYKLGDYVVQARLADNGAYATFEGVDQRLARRLIVKIKPRQASNSILQPHAKEGLLEKLQAIGRLSHPNIATLFDIGEQDGMIYFVREYLEGRPVTEVELAGDGFDNGLSALLLKIVRALLHARTHGIHHLNLKPSNIWTNEGQILKITDFYCDHFSIRSHPTPATFLSSKFLAPEIIADSPGDERSDIYSIGVMASELSQAHLAAMDPQSDNGWLALIRRATQNDPALRFQTLSELELELRRIQIASLTSPQGQAAR